MFELFLSGGWLMFPILICSIVALAIICERSWTLTRSKIVPEEVLPSLLHNLQNRRLTKRYLSEVASNSPLGSVLTKGLQNLNEGHDLMMLKMAEQGRHCLHELERFLNTLGTIAAIAPLLGLLGTVTGMIEVFAAITLSGPTNAEGLAGGISQALLTTAFGLSVAIPSLMFHRHFNRRIDEFAVVMEQEAAKLSETIKEMHNYAEESTETLSDKVA